MYDHLTHWTRTSHGNLGPSVQTLAKQTLVDCIYLPEQRGKKVGNKVCLGLNLQLRDFYPIVFLLSDLEHVLLAEEVLILPIYLNHLC